MEQPLYPFEPPSDQPPPPLSPPPPPPPPEEYEDHLPSSLQPPPPPPPENDTTANGNLEPPPPPPPPQDHGQTPPPPTASSSKPEAITSTTQLPEDPKEMDRLLALESTAFFRELEIDRILSAFKLNPYDILEVSMEADTKELNKIYRKKSLLIHPDKVRVGSTGDVEDLYQRAVEAFDLLKKASTHLLDEEKRKILDETVMSARFLVLKEQFNLPPDTDPKTSSILQSCTPSFEERVRKQTKELMIDDELRKRKLTKLRHKMEGEEERKKEEEIQKRKRKAEEKEKWEDNRDERIAGWRAFSKNGSGKKKKTKGPDVLG
ncbi:unnamed protein product [Sympodiomycopsis kandeliae]